MVNEYGLLIQFYKILINLASIVFIIFTSLNKFCAHAQLNKMKNCNRCQKKFNK